MSSPSSPPEPPVITYEGYMLLMAWMDAHWTRENKNGNSFRDTFNAFKASCEQERHGASQNDGITTYQGRTGVTSPLPDYLLNPVPYVAFGRPDVLGMTLVDDIDMTQWVMANTDRTFEEASVAFCIRPGPIVARVQGLERHLVSMDRMIMARMEGRSQPLIVLVRMKLEGFSMMLDPVETQSSALLVSCKRILETWNILKSRGAADGLLTAEDLKEPTGPDEDPSWQMTLLDLQEEEEIGILFSCHNLSLPATFLGALRGMTIADLKRDCDRFSNWFDQNKGAEFEAKLLAVFKKEQAKKKEPGYVSKSTELLDASHVFRWTRSSVALHLQCFDDKNHERLVRGYCASLTQTQVPAGHSRPAAELVAKSQIRPKGAKAAANWQPCIFGNVDMLTGSLVIQKKMKKTAWIPTAAYTETKNIFQNLINLRTAMAEKEIWPTRHISGWATTLIVPIPAELSGAHGRALICDLDNVDDGHFPFLFGAINAVTGSIFDVGDNSISVHLRNSLQLAGLPITLKRAFMVLFEKYRSLATHPMRHESVLDIYDAMQTLWEVLSKWLPKLLTPNPADHPGPISVPRLPEESVSFLFQFATAVESAIDLRLRRLFPESSRHEWDLDFRGSMCQIMMAGETVLRAALGIVRRNVLGERASFRKLGVVNRMTVTASIFHELGGLGVEDHARLSYVDTDVSHLTHLAQLADYFHEAYHIIYEEMLMTANSQNPASAAGMDENNCSYLRGKLDVLLKSADNDEHKEYLEQISAEVFVAMMMLLTIGDGKDHLLWAHQANLFSSSPKSAFTPTSDDPLSIDEADQDLHNEYSQAFIPIAIVSAMLIPLKEECRHTGETDLLAACIRHYHNKQTLEMPTISEARDCFIENCTLIAQLLPIDFRVQPPGTRAGSSHPDVLAAQDILWKRDVLQRFDKAWTMIVSSKTLQHLWSSALTVAACFMADAAKTKHDDKDHLAEKWREVTHGADRLLDEADDQKAPVSPSRIFEVFGCDGPVYPAQGTAFVIRALHRMWTRYLPDPKLTPRREWRLPRFVTELNGQPAVSIDFKAGPYSTNYHDFLMDTIRPEGFCILTKQRARRLTDQAIFMKTLWGISYVIRRRRLDAMIAEYHDRNPPGPQPKKQASE